MLDPPRIKRLSYITMIRYTFSGRKYVSLIPYSYTHEGVERPNPLGCVTAWGLRDLTPWGVRRHGV